MAPTPVATRLPQPSKTDDTVNGFLRVESSGGFLRADGLLYDVGVILHAYAPNSAESAAEQLLATALGWGGNAMGTTITHPSSQVQYFVAFSRVSGAGVRLQDPLVNLTRFVGKVSWRLQGRYVASS